DETSRACMWHLPRAHYLESWGDARSWDGTAGVVQPLIEPLFGGKTPIEVLAILTGDKVMVADETPAAGERPAAAGANPAAAPEQGSFFVRFDPDPRVYDGRFANNGWLQETPDSLAKLVWDNAAMLAKVDADKLGVTTNDMIRVEIPSNLRSSEEKDRAYAI